MSGKPDFRVRLADWHEDESKLKAVRHQVFVIEQGVPETLEWDGIDAQCRHALVEDEAGNAIGCGRLLPDGHIGRMAVQASWRNKGVGAALLSYLVDLAQRTGHPRVLLNAQVQAMPFYAQRGFTAYGETFDEAGIPHQAMQKML